MIKEALAYLYTLVGAPALLFRPDRYYFYVEFIATDVAVRLVVFAFLMLIWHGFRPWLRRLVLAGAGYPNVYVWAALQTALFITPNIALILWAIFVPSQHPWILHIVARSFGLPSSGYPSPCGRDSVLYGGYCYEGGEEGRVVEPWAIGPPTQP